jgi:hypothetical protein
MTRIVARASRYGGEHVVGTITQEQGHFWLEMGEALFTRCVHSLGVGWGGDVDDAWNIPERLRVPEFYDIDDLVHLNAPEFADQNVIEFAKVVGDEEETLGELELGSDDLVAREEETPRYEGDGVVVYAQHFVKGAFETAFEIEGDAFDVSRVRLRVARWSDLRLVVGFEHDGEEVEHDGWQDDTRSKDECAWIDEDTLKMDHREWRDANPALVELVAAIRANEGVETSDDDGDDDDDDDVTRGVASLALSSIPAPSARGTSAAYVPEVRATARSPIRRRSRASTSRCR